MPRLRFTLAALLSLSPASVLAQSSDGLSVYYDETLVENQSTVLRLNQAECDDNVEIKFEITLQTGVGDITGSTLELWESATGTDCSAPAGREDPNGNDCTQASCRRVGYQQIRNTNNDLVFKVLAQDLFGAEDGDGCRAGNRKVTFVAVDSQSCANGDAQTDLFLNNGGSSYFATFELDTLPAAVPNNLKVANGDSTLRATWGRGDGNVNDVYTVYVDTDPGTDCSDPLFEGGETALDADEMTLVDEFRSFSAKTTAKDLSTATLGLEYGDFAAVYVSAETVSGNRSALTALACGERVPTQGPVSAVEDKLGRKVQSCSSGENRASSAGAILLGLAGLWLVHRRESRA